MAGSRGGKRGFTIVELLVVIGVMALLMGLLLPALNGVKRRSHKSQELNNLRQLGQSWMIYSNSNKGAALPGYLEPDVQERWKVSYDYPDRSTIPPAPSYNAGEPNIAGPWTWRILPYLDSLHSVLHGYHDEVDGSMLTTIAEAEEFSLTPAFGYNSFYVGGWWEMSTAGSGQVPRPRYAVDLVTGKSRNVTIRSIGTIRRSEELVTFCSSALRDPGTYKTVPDDIPGSHYVCPSILAGETVWGLAGSQGSSGGQIAARTGGDPYTIEIFEAEPAPIGRYTKQAAVLFADGHVGNESPGALIDQRKWIDSADSEDYTHTP